MLCAVLLGQTAMVAQPNWRLVWNDEFTVEGRPSPENWVYEKGFVRNQELQLYQEENVEVKGGLLVITGRKERRPNPAHQPGSEDWRASRSHGEYTSGSIKTMGRHKWTFGRFEARGRFGVTSGLWPAFWTVGTAREWPSGGEIDIMEFFRSTYLANAAWGSRERWKAIWDDSRAPIEDVARQAGFASAAEWARHFHTWRMDWDKDWIRLYLDGRLMNEIDLSKTVNQSVDGKNPFHEPHHIILNLAIGATGGDPAGTVWPQRFEVDWVRVYQRA